MNALKKLLAALVFLALSLPALAYAESGSGEGDRCARITLVNAQTNETSGVVDLYPANSAAHFDEDVLDLCIQGLMDAATGTKGVADCIDGYHSWVHTFNAFNAHVEIPSKPGYHENFTRYVYECSNSHCDARKFGPKFDVTQHKATSACTWK